MQKKVSELWTNKLKETKKEKAQFESEVVDISKEIKHVQRQIGAEEEEDQENQPATTENCSLLEQISSLKQTLSVHVAKRSQLIGEANNAIRQLNEHNQILRGGIDIRDLDNPEAQGSCDGWFDVMEPATESTEDVSSKLTQRILQIVQAAREQLSLRRQWVDAMCVEIYDMLSDLGLKQGDKGFPPKDAIVDEELDGLILAQDSKALGVDWDTVIKLKQRENELVQVRTSRTSRLKQLAKHITNLWNTLQTPDNDRKDFLQKHSGLTISTLDACSKELSRLEVLKAEHVKVQIQRGKERLLALWEEIGLTEQQQKAFKPQHSDSFSNETLECILAEINKLDKIATTMRPLLELIKQREEILETQAEIEASAKKLGSKRFSIPGRLIMEEKVRKRAKKTLPKIHNQLMEGLVQWENENGRPLIFNGVRYLQVLQQYEQEMKATRSRRATSSTRRGRSTTRS